MARRNGTDPIMLLMLERNVDLERELDTARKTIIDQQKEIDILYHTISRPIYSTFSEQQIQLLAELLCIRMTDFSKVKTANVH